MDSGNSGSMQSSSGGEDQDHEISRPEPVLGFLNSLTQFGSSDPNYFLSHYQNHNHQPTTSALFDHHLSSNHNYDLHTTLSQPQPNPSNPNFMPNPNPRSIQPNPSNQIPNPPALPSSGQTATTAAPRNSKKRTRASRRAPTTVLTTDTSNFRAMVQEFTGIPAPPFSGSSSSYSRRSLDIFSSGSAGIRSPLYPLRPVPQKVHLHPTPFLSSSNNNNNNNSNNHSIMVDATNVATTSNNITSNFNYSSNYRLLSDHHHQNQGLFPNMQNPILTFQPTNIPFHSSSIHDVANLGVRPRGGIGSSAAMHSISIEDQWGLSHVSASDGNNAIDGSWRDHGVLLGSSSDGRLTSQDGQHLRPNLDKCLEMNNNVTCTTTRGEGTVDSWICRPNNSH